MEFKRLLTYALKLQRERGNDHEVARILRNLSDSNWKMDLAEEGIQQAREALGIYERLGDTTEQAKSLVRLARLLRADKQFDAAEESALRAVDFFSEKGDRFELCDSHRILGQIYRFKGETEKAVHHYGIALEIASSSNWHNAAFWANYSLAQLFLCESRFDDACAHVERARPHAHSINSTYCQGRVAEIQARIWYKQHKLKEAKSEFLHAADIYERLGAAKDLESCRKFLQDVEKELNTSIASGPGQSDSNICELL